DNEGAMADKPRAIIIGGSIGGLFSACLLRDAGWQTDVYERSGRDLAGRGTGIAISRELMEVLDRIGVRLDISQIRPAKFLSWIGAEGEVKFEVPRRLVGTAWAQVWRPLRMSYADENYHRGKIFTQFEQTEDSVTAFFEDGSSETGDILIAADGGQSAIRTQAFPAIDPNYASYIAWRGVVDDTHLPATLYDMVFERMIFSFEDGELALFMHVPSLGDDDAGRNRRYYFIWYAPVTEDERRQLFRGTDGKDYGTAIPPPLIQPNLVEAMKVRAADIFNPNLAAIIRHTEEPLIQAISDLTSEQLVQGRIAVLGDAAFVARPHVIGGITKAALDAQYLADALEAATGDIISGLANFNNAQLALGKYLVGHARNLGIYVDNKYAPRTLSEEARAFLEPAHVIRQYGAPEVLHEPDLSFFKIRN
ncbi:MAG: FAD-dependent monooxygenase, partial [Pseudomonadota bacterium]|nr:FAD-dependent monooxygenase [Pseudomonadota bacterium]